jgi:hypothetical protein
MTLDPDLLRTARAAAERLADAERDALLARADYHTTVRRLHLRGGSLREIAAALEVSHQRVQQIVTAAGGSWWRRVWRGRRLPLDATCTWCGRPPAEVNMLIAGPRVYICDACVRAAEHPSAPFARMSDRAGGRCSFCSKRPDGNRRFVGTAKGSVCSECLQVCLEILSGSKPEHPSLVP